MRVWRRWAVVAVAVLAAGACSETTDDAASATPQASGNAARFCALWPDARTTLLGVVTGEASFEILGDESIGVESVMRSHDTSLEDADTAAPAAIRADWDAAYGTYTAVSDLLYTVGYNEAVLRPAYLTMVFGDGGHDGAVTDTEAAVAAIDDWAIEACGDFCARWPEFEHILRYEEHFDWGEWHDNLDRYLLAIATGDRLAPDAVRDEWEVAADIQRRRMTMFRDNDYRLDVDEETALARWGVIPWDEAKAASDHSLDVVQNWADTNCDAAVLTIGAPGTVAVRYSFQPELASATLMAVVLPAGVDFASVRNVDDYVAVTCSHLADRRPDTRPEDVPAETLRPIEGQGEYFTGNVCNLIQHEERAVVSGGAHELFVGAFQGGPGAYGLYFAAPQWCIQIPIGVNGTTVVDVPPLEPCDLAPVGSADEVARRTLPSGVGEGRLRIELPTGLGRDGYDFCNLSAYLLPSGTTLNDIGRGDVWPAGTINVSRGRTGDVAEDRAVDYPGSVPILAMAPSGTGEVPAHPTWEPGLAWDEFFPDPQPIENGTYDLWVYEWCAVEEAGSEDYWCAMATVDVAGDTTVPLPELGECP